MHRIVTITVIAGTLGLVACSDSPTRPEELVEELVEQPRADEPGSLHPDELAEPPAASEQPPTDELRVWGMRWVLSDLPPHWVYYWSGGAARRLTVSRISEPAEVVWELVDVSGGGICAGARVVNGSCPGGALMHGHVPAGARVTVDVDPVLSLTPIPPPLSYRLSVVLMDGRQGGFEFTTYRP